MTALRLLKNGPEIFPALFAAIDRARASIALEMYIYADDGTGRELLGRLINAARRGVRVMVLVDAVGSWSLPGSFWSGLHDAGGLVKQFRPVRRGLFLFRNHRKLVLVDDHTAVIGGMNIADEYFHGRAGERPWRDNALEINGSMVPRLRRSFDRMWRRADLTVLRAAWSSDRGGTGPEADNGTVRFLESGPEDLRQQVSGAYREIIGGAARSIDLAMGYFYPHGRILRALKRAVARGVRVRLMVPRDSDVAVAKWATRGLYGRLLRAGLEVWEYRPAMLHAKIAVIDDIVIAGSANLDIRSGRINYELVAVVSDGGLAARARADFEQDIAQADRVTLKEWKERPLFQRLKELVSYWLLARLDIFIARAEIARQMR